MKRTVLLTLCVLFTSSLFAQNLVVTDAKGKKTLLGKTTKEGLLLAPFSDWFNANYDSYLENAKAIKAIKKNLKNYDIKVFFGSWCGDSKKELPRFYKVLEEANFPSTQLEVIAVDRTKEAYKQSPEGEEKGLNIHRVPTFIFYKDGKEVNRIVEHPKETLERDILAIISDNKYTPHYKGVHYLENLINDKSLAELQSMEAQILSELSEKINGCYELNTYAYVKLRANELKNALYIFDINAKLFPNKDYVHYSLGVGNYTIGNYKEALTHFYKALALNPDYQRTKEMISEIELQQLAKN